MADDAAAAAADPNGGTTPEGACDEVVRQGRLPRWTRQEILVLIQGKKVAETRSRRGRAASERLGIGSGQLEPKWASVSSYCGRHGVNRGPVQCRKRWSNLAGDYKKIKEWEGTAGREGKESFWVMRNDVRRERKLPGFFDREVYDILDRGVEERTVMDAEEVEAIPREEEEAVVGAAVREEEGERAVVFDSGRTAAAEDGLFSDGETEEVGGGRGEEMAGGRGGGTASAAVPLSESQHDPILQTSERPGRANQKRPASGPEIGSSSQEPWKRQRLVAEGEDEEEPVSGLRGRMLDALERNDRLLAEQLESQNRNLQLDRDQRKSQTDGLLSVLNRLADALGRIADKL